MEIRRTRPADVPTLFDIFNEAIGELYRRHAFDPPAPPLAFFANQQEHVLAHDGERCAIAEDDGRALGFASAWRRGDAWFLASLFVRPGAQARGVGSALLDAVWDEDAKRRLTITDAIQPISNALYARRGLVPATPLLGFTGTPEAAPASGPALEPGEATAEDVARIDAAAYGFDRAVDHAYWSRHARRSDWARDGEVAAWTYVFPGGGIGPVAGVDEEAAAAALRAELARARGAVRVRAPGSSRRLVGVALAAGLRLEPAPGLLLLSEGVEPPRTLAIGSYTIF